MLQSSMLYPQSNAGRRSVRLDGMWKFQLDPNSCGTVDGWMDGLPAPDEITVPASFADLYTDKQTREFCGDFWYETEVFVPDEWKGKEIDIRFGSVTHRATVYFNGIEVVSHEGGFLPFCARVTEIARYGAANKLVVLANNELSETAIPCGTTGTLPSGRKVAKPYFDFYNYSGIQRPVWLVATPKESIFDFSVSHTICGADAVVTYDVVTTGESNVTIEVQDEEGRTVATACGKRGEIT
ncbi:MAG: beta-glucuronidase, partial [Eubacteriales bacterium]|nr:beta-glucuronidase [Eubacteriales bacterium]